MENKGRMKWNWMVLFPFLLFYLIITYFVRNNSFFWDTIQLGSDQAHWFYENNFHYFFLPENIDSGHPPSFGMYLAVVWKLFGRSLMVSHFAMLPFLVGIVIQLFLLVRKFFDQKFIPFVLLVLLIDPTLLSQSILVSPDIVLFFFFLLSINSILDKNTFLLVIGLIGLAIISLRGMMCVASLYFINQIYELIEKRNFSFKYFIYSSLIYVPPVAIASTWLFLHYKHTGWIGYHENSPWALSFAKASFSEAIKNVFILGWRLLDFGRIGIWFLAVPLIVISVKRKLIDDTVLRLCIVLLILTLVVTPNLILHKGLLAHRYLLLLYFFVSMIVLYMIQKVWPRRFQIITVILILFLVTGNFWVYPDKVAKGWDSSLAHYPYYKMRREMIEFLDQQKLDKNKIGSAFPNLTDVYYTDLATTHWQFKDKDLSKDQYIFYSNVFNDFSDEELEKLKDWEVVKELTSPTVKMILYKKISK